MITSTQPAAPAAAQPPTGGDQGITAVCVAAQPDGTYSVYPEGQQDAGQPAQDIDSALQLVQQMLERGTDVGQASSSAEQDADALFQGGFNGVRGK